MRLLILLALWLSMATSLAARATEPGSMRLGGIRPTWYASGAAVDPAALCEAAVVTAEHRAGLPADLLRAISLTESGRVDAADGRTRAVAAVRRLQARGVRSVDVGCLQVNLMYHPDAFVSLEEAFDPAANARYAAGFLNALYADRKTWAGAIAAYHSETPALGDPYRVLVMTRWQNGNLRALPMRSVLESAYRDFARDDRSYGAFAPQSRVYGAFAPR
jgi:hypothetical protein